MGLFGNGKNTILYQIKGRELDQLRTAQARAMQAQQEFLQLALFIATREEVDVNTVTFDTDRMAFVQRVEPAKEP